MAKENKVQGHQHDGKKSRKSKRRKRKLVIVAVEILILLGVLVCIRKENRLLLPNVAYKFQWSQVACDVGEIYSYSTFPLT